MSSGNWSLRHYVRLGVTSSHVEKLAQHDRAILLAAYAGGDAALAERTSCSHLHLVERSVSTALEGMLRLSGPQLLPVAESLGGQVRQDVLVDLTGGGPRQRAGHHPLGRLEPAQLIDVQAVH